MRKAPERLLSCAFADAASLLESTHRTLENSKKLNDHIAANVSIEIASFANVIRPLIDDANRASSSLQIAGGLLSSVSPDASLRNASREADKLISDAQHEALLRRDIAVLVNAAYDREKEQEAKGLSQLDRQDWTIFQRLQGQYARSGSTLPDEELNRLRTLQSELKQVCLDAVRAVSDADDGMWFTRAELSGLSPEELADLRLNKSPPGDDDNGCGDGVYNTNKIRGEDKFWVSFRTGTTILEDATSPLTRKRFDIATDRRFPANVERLQKAIALRDEIARLLGFRHHADLRFQEDMMSSSAEETISTLQEMERRLLPLRDRELEQALHFKKRDLESEGSSKEDKEPILYAWDWSFYAKQIPQLHKSNLDKSKLREYFETNHTLKQMLCLFERLLGMEFIEVQGVEEGSLWHESVVSYEVWSSMDEGGDFLGWLYTDIFNREGKYQNAHHFKIRPGFIEADGTQHYPVSALICSFDPPSASQPSLLSHARVTLMFHELGHAIHNLVSRTKYALPHSRDFIEVPSVMLEHWTWNADVLVAIGKHYTSLGQDVKLNCVKEESSIIATSSPAQGEESDIGALPRELAVAVVSTKPLRQARLMMILIQRALFDLKIHSPSTHLEALNLNTTELWNNTRQEIVGLALSDKPGEESLSHGQFTHLFRKYDAGFFAYPMCQAWSEDLYSHGFNPEQPFDEDAARRYRRLVLEPGSSVPEVEILEKFLGRRLSLDAFYARLTGMRG